MAERNYFEFFGLPVSFYLDEKQLKKKYLLNSKKYHPDHFTLENDEKQSKALELSALNNEAYETLKDFDKRMAYILKSKGLVSEESKNELPQSFLMEMMEINEALMELEFEPNEGAVKELKSKVDSIEKSLLVEVEPIFKGYSEESGNDEELEKVKKVFLKKKYLWRIKENLNRFAAASKEA